MHTLPPAREAHTSPIRLSVDFLCKVPMGVWKRLALYPLLWRVLLGAFLPCRVTASGTVEMLALSAIGLAGVIAHFAE